jgi:histidinol dehydrogenase
VSEALRIYTLDEAKSSLLKRTALGETDDVPESLLERITAIFGERLSPQQAVQTILRDVRATGDAALRDWTKRLDGAELKSLEVSAKEIAEGAATTRPEVMEALKLAAERIERFYRKQPIPTWTDSDEEGTLGQIVLPIERVGIYVPGGTAPLPSTLLMCAIPAKVAGVKEIIVCSPPGRDGSLPAVILAAAQVAGVKRIFKLGGAQAIGGMAFGSASVPRVDKIVGPGNLFVLLAKREVYGSVGIDGMLGPTETLIIADEQANPELIAADLLAQAEHDILAQAILLTPSRMLAEKVSACVEEQGKKLSRASIFSQSLCERGGAVIVPDMDTAFEVANSYAPEHLQLSIQEPERWQHKVKHAGAIFVGEHSFEVLGDYVAGPSHSLPTAGSARFGSGLNVLDFVKITSVIGLTQAASRKLSGPAETLALAEELTAHAAAARARRQQ